MNEKEYNKTKKYLLEFLKKFNKRIVSIEEFRNKKEDEHEEYVGCYYIVDFTVHIETSGEDITGYKYDYRKCLVDKKEFDKFVEKKERRKIIWLNE